MSFLQPSLEKLTYIEISLNGRDLSVGQKEAARKIFTDCKVPSAQLALTDYKGLFRLGYYTRSLRQARRLQRHFQKFPIKNILFRTKMLGRHDWFDKWKRDYHIRSIGAKFMIVPIWEKKKFKDSRRIPIFLEPGSAFGSGYHETTRLMVRLMELWKGPRKSFLDIGTGTGILSVVASKLGAEKVAAFDYDRPSVVAACKNFRMNGCVQGEFFGANLKTLKRKERFDIVGANLISKMLLECKCKILPRVRPGGVLLVSGISKENFPDFQKNFIAPELKCLKTLRGRKWVAVLYRKS